MKNETREVDFCVVGGGLAGLCAAVAAARHGAKVALVQDRPVLGGNASSEIRMHVCGAHGKDNRETGIVEEIELENMRRNPAASYSLWDSVLYGLARYQPNLTLLLNCSVNAAEMDRGRIRSVTGWQLTTETWQTVRARLFSDCSGDSILAPLSGAEFRIGREARGEYDEDIEPPTADRRTMGMSCLIQARETDRPQEFIPPVWANRYPTCESLPKRHHDVRRTNFWWIELGGEDDSIHDTERLRDELLKAAFGVWDHVKNHCPRQDMRNWTLEWVGFLPGKRESRRYVGDHVLTQNDVRAEGRFDDLVAYGGWSMDDHHPAGMRHPGEPTIFHPAPSPYGIPYRCLYSRNVANLLFAGRNISATHAAMSSTRVMSTCATLGQAVGTAAAIAVRDGLDPRGVYEKRVDELQQTLMDDDCYLPFLQRRMPASTARAKLSASRGDAEALRNGMDRPVGGSDNAWTAAAGDWVQYELAAPATLREARIAFDSNLNREWRGENTAGFKNLPFCYPRSLPALRPPATLVRAFHLEAREPDGTWRVVQRCEDNFQRFVRVPLEVTTSAVRLTVESTWGAETARVFRFDVR